MTDARPWTVSTRAERPVDVASLLQLFRVEGWWPQRTEQSMSTVIDGGPAVGAWVGDRLVGFARAVCDGAFRAYVEDVIVAQDMRRSGLAQELLHTLLDALPPGATVSLFCSKDLREVYLRAGFKPTKQVVMHRQPVDG